MADLEKQGETVLCPKCGAVIGKVVNIEGLEMLRTGCLTIRYLHGFCECGADFHWSVSDRMLSNLIERMRRFNGN